MITTSRNVDEQSIVGTLAAMDPDLKIWLPLDGSAGYSGPDLAQRIIDGDPKGQAYMEFLVELAVDLIRRRQNRARVQAQVEVPSTLNDHRPAAVIARERGWTVGTHLTGDEGYGPNTIVITGLGEKTLLARFVDQRGVCANPYEHAFALGYRDWQEVDAP